MKYARVLIVLPLLLFPFLSFAHTSDERYVDGYVVDLSTAPVAPWVGEKVGMSFAFLEPSTMRATSSIKSASITIDAMMRPNNKLQEVIYESGEFSVENGGFVTDYVFAEEGTYDMHLTFTDVTGNTHITGFRKQIRTGNNEAPPGVGPELFFGTIFVVLLLGFIGGRLSRVPN